MKDLIRYTNWKLLSLYLIIVSFGIINLYSVSNSLGQKQLIWFSVCLLIFLILSVFNIVFLELYSFILYCFGLLLLVGLFVAGKEINGAKAWYAFGGFTFQPAEFMKLFVALFLSHTINSKFQKLLTNQNIIYCFIILGIPIFLILFQPDLGSVIIFSAFLIPLYREGLTGYIFLLLLFLVLLFLTSIFILPIYIISTILILFLLLGFYTINSSISRDLELNNTLYQGISISLIVVHVFLLILSAIKSEIPKTITIISFILCLLFLYFSKNKLSNLNNNHRKNILLTSTIFIIIGLSIFAFSNLSYTIFNNFLKPHQKERILVLIEGESKFKRTSGYNLLYSKTAIGSGELFGKGYLNGTITAGKFVPEQETDYIFTTIGEEWGFIGSSTIVLLYCILIAYIYNLAEKQRSRFSRIYGYSIASIYLIHFTLNISMVMGLFPTVGIPLPFFSYGGTSFVAFSVMFFIFLKLNYRNDAYLK